jgi:hypothetical protein
MTPEQQKQLELKIAGELRQLGELTAPPSLAPRILRAIEQRAMLPWYQRPWQAWPVSLRNVAAVILLAGFSLLFAVVWQLMQSASMDLAAKEFLAWIQPLVVLWDAAVLLLNSLFLAVKSIHPAVLAGIAAAVCATYATCVGLGTIYLRLALARRAMR